ncbi:hypothetical protein T265_00522 [Opisthorchis viverrini]|uniref:Uncharacterized protein n=1 Tax=Opisthorchis viverrini TaxID=6198 RepID=A0A075A2Q3_OPIVI|nr:hypothetical protein T265_00522 [Opisthorchis viverrini]KER33631.1 hypothetical protein T265_00522 [Opisthorchis viverrini]
MHRPWTNCQVRSRDSQPPVNFFAKALEDSCRTPKTGFHKQHVSQHVAKPTTMDVKFGVETVNPLLTSSPKRWRTRAALRTEGFISNTFRNTWPSQRNL